jgi:hypothetical protein
VVHWHHSRPRSPRRLVLGLDVGFDGSGYCACPATSTVGTDSLLQVNLQVLSLAGTPDEQRQAPRVLKLLKSGRHTMLVVLLLGEYLFYETDPLLNFQGNTLVNTSLPIFLDSIASSFSLLCRRRLTTF